MAPKIPQRPGSRVVAAAPLFVLALCFVALAACKSRPPLDPEAALIAKGRKIFLTETFEGNGRTCATCHRAEDNFGITPAFIATLPPDDPLFVAETNPDLAENFENPRLMRAFALILENQDGFDDLANNFNMRGVPHTLALSTSVDSTQGPRTGW
jgi:mono/diheme cytochrome c family protein